MNVHLHATIDNSSTRAMLISFSAEGCAFRTTTHLKAGQNYTLVLDVIRDGKVQQLKLKGQLVASHDDYMIDTFYRHHLRFPEPLSSDLQSILMHAEQRAA